MHRRVYQTGHLDSNGQFISDEGKTGIDYVNESDTEAEVLCAKFKMHNGRNKTKEEQIRKPAHCGL